MITESQMHEALMFIAGSDEKHAELFADMERAQEKVKQVKGAMFLLQTGTIPEREAKAINSPEYNAALTEYWSAVRVFKKKDNERRQRDLLIRAWQTVSSNRRQGGM